MNNIREIVASNILNLRKHNHLTQLELAEKIKYSDKAISRWEKGEVLPDIETLSNLAEIFGVSISYMFEEHIEVEKKFILTKEFTNKTIMALLSISVIWLIATIAFVYAGIFLSISFWQAFIWAIPATIMVCIQFNRKWGKKWLGLIMSSVFIWTLLLSLYLQFISYKMWLLFILGIPLQCLVVVAYFIKKKK